MLSTQKGISALIMLLAAVPDVRAAEYPLSGLNPGQRPVEAPVITAVQHPGSWYTAALFGVSKPYPFSLRFLEDQGNWHTPFNRPGMPGRYDIRGWHTR